MAPVWWTDEKNEKKINKISLYIFFCQVKQFLRAKIYNNNNSYHN